MVRLEHIEKTFNKGKNDEFHVLRDVSVEFPTRGMYALCGKSGSGKTTLLNVIGGLARIDSGEIYIDDKPVSHDSVTTRIQQIGYVFQNFCLSEERTCFDNVADVLRIDGLTNEETIRQHVEWALNSVGMLKNAERFPQTLSGGQQQRVAIARAIVKHPKVVLADEPTGNLDEANKETVMKLLCSISKRCLVIVVTHDPEIVKRYCDGSISVRDGEASELALNHAVDADITESQRTDMDRLGLSEIDAAPVKKREGKLFRWRDSLKRGWKEAVGGVAGQRALRWCLTLLSVLLVFMTAHTWKVLQNCADANALNNKKVFYGYIGDAEAANKIEQTVKDGVAGLKSMAFSESPIGGDSFTVLQFDAYENSLVSNWDKWRIPCPHGAILPERMLCDVQNGKGKCEGLVGNEAIITTSMAEQLTKSKSISVLSAPESLIGFKLSESEGMFQIVGVVQSEEPALYVSETYYALRRFSYEYPFVAFKCDNKVHEGNVVLIRNIPLPEKEEATEANTIVLNGTVLSISEVRDLYYPYSQWLAEYVNEPKQSQEEYCTQKECSIYAYWDYYFEEYSEYLNYCFEHQEDVNFDACMELAYNGNQYAMYYLKEDIIGSADYYYASIFFNDNGHYPNENELDSCYVDYPEISSKLEKELELDQLYRAPLTYLMNKTDCISCAASFGESKGYGIDETLRPTAYVVMYTDDPIETDNFVKSWFVDHDKEGFSYMSPVQEAKKSIAQRIRQNAFSFILYGLLIIAVIFILHIIIKSSMIKKEKALTVYRCLGVSSGNIAFRFCVETVVMIAVTACIGALISGIGLRLLLNSRYAALFSDTIYYSWTACFGIPIVLALLGLALSGIVIAFFVRRDIGTVLSEQNL